MSSTDYRLSAKSWQTPLVVLLGGCLISLIGFGARSSYGLYMGPITEQMDWPRETFAFAMALQNLFWGLCLADDADVFFSPIQSFKFNAFGSNHSKMKFKVDSVGTPVQNIHVSFDVKIDFINKSRFNFDSLIKSWSLNSIR